MAWNPRRVHVRGVVNEIEIVPQFLGIALPAQTRCRMVRLAGPHTSSKGYGGPRTPPLAGPRLPANRRPNPHTHVHRLEFPHETGPQTLQSPPASVFGTGRLPVEPHRPASTLHLPPGRTGTALQQSAVGDPERLHHMDRGRTSRLIEWPGRDGTQAGEEPPQCPAAAHRHIPNAQPNLARARTPAFDLVGFQHVPILQNRAFELQSTQSALPNEARSLDQTLGVTI